jgi:nitroimidazol reductase NimA-like FMN-containing flavoprotein (pyridoxamine 5'-phosphate oxidase superfamily)
VAAGIEELTGAEVEAFLAEQVVGRIGCHVDGTTYVVPVIYAYADGCVHVFTVEGRKVEMMRANPSVCFEVDEYDADGRGSWRSVIAEGAFEELRGDDAERVLALLAARFRRDGERRDPTRRPRGGSRPGVAFRIRLREATGRAVRR